MKIHHEAGVLVISQLYNEIHLQADRPNRMVIAQRDGSFELSVIQYDAWGNQIGIKHYGLAEGEIRELK